MSSSSSSFWGATTSEKFWLSQRVNTSICFRILISKRTGNTLRPDKYPLRCLCDPPEIDVGSLLKCTMRSFDFNYSWNKSTNLVKLPESMFKENSFSALNAVLFGQTRHGDFSRRIFANLQWERNTRESNPGY